MKYIRTKDGAIYKIENNKLIVGNIKVNCKDLQALEQEGYKIADTIEELCDEFVIKHIQGEKPYLPDNFKKELIAVDKQDIFKYGVQNLYGAIWTDKGLIYVAKMNNDGVLELI